MKNEEWRKTLVSILCAFAITAGAQTSDPVVMTINGQNVTRSEFEYSYNKNNGDEVIEKTTVEQYVPLFVNYKLKVAAALDARLDTLASFKQEFAKYRDQQVRPTIVTSEDVENEARKIYDDRQKMIGDKGLIRPAHILIRLAQKASSAAQDSAKARIDSIYACLRSGADFADLATRLSQDPGSAKRGGLLPWICIGQTLKEFEDVAFSLNKGEMSKPFLSPVGYHIVKMTDRKQLEPYDSLRANIITFIEKRNLRDAIAQRKVSEMVKSSNGQLTAAEIMQQRADSLAKVDETMKYLIQEYHDGLLLFEVSNREVWEKAAADSVGQMKWYKKYRKKRYGKKKYEEVKAAVTADWQDELEKRWVAALRKRYDVVIYDEILKTVNKHN
ncbi:MAG: peptidylprolyl isomerase [Prevotellaceae bacterium]|nr:peptidylprolyl isomerase [Prevotellaceae bacterium]MDY5209333.1 peptidylprolyl isomerase [Prevotella sp.]